MDIFSKFKLSEDYGIRGSASKSNPRRKLANIDTSSTTNITDIDIVNYVLLELDDKTTAKKYVKQIQGHVKKYCIDAKNSKNKIKNIEFINFEGGIDMRFYPQKENKSFNYSKIKKFINKTDLQKIKELDKKDKCYEYLYDNILKNYYIINWTKEDLVNGYIEKHNAKFKLIDILFHKNTNKKFIFILFHNNIFIEVEFSYKFYYTKNNLKYAYNKYNFDLIYDIYKFYCKGKYLKIIKRLRSILTMIYFQSIASSTTNINPIIEVEPISNLELITEKYKHLATSAKGREIRYKIKQDIKTNPFLLIKMQRKNRIDAILEMYKLFNKNKKQMYFEMNCDQFYKKYIINMEALQKEKEDAQEYINTYGKKLLKKYVDFMIDVLELDFFTNDR